MRYVSLYVLLVPNFCASSNVLTFPQPVLVVGGGVIADIAGFACALFHRNTPYVMLATSIVAGIDAGPSPRTCCDGQGYKNAFGAFHPPVYTLTDKTLWKTMHPGMIRHGCAEIVKMAVVENRELFELLEKVGPKYLVKTKFGTDLDGIDTTDVDLDQLDYDCERVIGMAMGKSSIETSECQKAFWML